MAELNVDVNGCKYSIELVPDTITTKQYIQQKIPLALEQVSFSSYITLHVCIWTV